MIDLSVIICYNKQKIFVEVSEMKKSLIGVGLILFAILLQMISAGNLEILTMILGCIGLVITVVFAFIHTD
jgi:hypothetical protein